MEPERRISDIGGIDLGLPDISAAEPSVIPIEIPGVQVPEGALAPPKRGVKRPRPVRQDKSTQLSSKYVCHGFFKKIRD